MGMEGGNESKICAAWLASMFSEEGAAVRSNALYVRGR